MSINEEGKNLTEGQFCSIEQVRAKYNKDDVTEIWNRVIAYRRNFNYETDLRDASHNPYFITLTRTILTKAHNIEIKLMKDLIDFSSLSTENKEKLLLERKIYALKAVNRFKAQKEINDDLYERIAHLTIDSLPSSLISLNAYSSAYNTNFFLSGINLENIERVNKHVLNEPDAINVEYREEGYEDVINPLTLIDPKEIPLFLNNLIAFLKDENLSYIIRAIGLVYALFSLRPFKYLNEETCSLLAKSFLVSSPLSAIGYLLDFESICFSKSESVFKKAKECENTLELSYFVDMVLPFFEREEKNISEKINFLLKEEKEKANALESNEEIKYEIERKTSLPFFPTNDKNQPSEIVKKLKELYPSLKEKQAHFFATHCTIGLFYTISQFQKEENTVYETARTSMDELARLGLYLKTKVNKKFVYAPVPKNDINK